MTQVPNLTYLYDPIGPLALFEGESRRGRVGHDVTPDWDRGGGAMKAGASSVDLCHHLSVRGRGY